MIRRLRRLRQDRSGSTIIEFAILAPIIVTMFLGILQVGIWMQSYNALRSLAADTGRYVAIKYQKSETLTNIDMALWAKNYGRDHYNFRYADLVPDVSDAATQKITGVTEKTLTLKYKYKSYLAIIGGEDATITFKRPIFVKET